MTATMDLDEITVPLAPVRRDTGQGFAAIIDVNGTPSLLGERGTLDEAIALALGTPGAWVERWSGSDSSGFQQRVAWVQETDTAGLQ